MKKITKHPWYFPLDENTVKGAKGSKVKVFFQGLHMKCVTFVLVYKFIICISSAPFNTTF